MTCYGFNPYDTEKLLKRDYKFLGSKQFHEMLQSQVILELGHVKLMKTTVLKAKTVTCFGFDMQINFYYL